MQPQTFPTGSDGQTSGGAGGANTYAQAQPELPAPQFDPAPPMPPVSQEIQAPPPSASTSSPTRPLEYWAAEVEQLLIQPGQNPKQRADALMAIKQRYQQEVLGLQHGGGSRP